MIFYIRQNSFIVKYLIIWLVYTLLYTLAIYFVLPVGFKILLLDSVIHSLLLSLLGFFVWGVIRHSRYSELKPSQRIINYIILPISTLTAWIFIGYTADIIFIGESYATAIASTIPLKVLTGVLISVIMIVYSIYRRVEDEKREEERREEMRLFRKAEDVSNISGSIDVVRNRGIAKNNKENDDIAQVENSEREREPEESEVVERVTIKTGGKIAIISVADIIYIQSYGDYVNLITENGKFVKEQTMKYFETSLPRHLFVRVHRSYIVNISKISGIELFAKQNQQIVLVNGERLRISAAGYKVLKRHLAI
jgi:Response regulator of the LytR/AlgR family